MFAQICLLLSALFAGEVTLANGIRVVDLPVRGDSFEMIVGYQVENHPLASLASTFLMLTPSARAMALAAYGAGGEIELLSDPNRTAIRISGPVWLKPLIEHEAANFFTETPEQNPNLVERVVADARFSKPPDFRTSVENDLRAALLGPQLASNDSSLDADQFIEFFRNNYGTDKAFVLSSAPLIGLEGIPARKSVRTTAAPSAKTSDKRELRYKPDLPAGAVILGSHVPAVYYEGWYAELMLDRLIRRTVPSVSTFLVPSIDAYYYRLEVPVPEGQFDDIVEGRFIDELERLQSTYVKTEIFEAARADAIEYLERETTRLWFESLGIEDRRLEGIDRVRTFAPDDIRTAMRDLLADRVVASWPPKPRQTTIEVEALDAPKPQTGADAGNRPELPQLRPVPIPAFPDHAHDIPNEMPPERLESGVTLASSSTYAVFVAPEGLIVFDHEPGAKDLEIYAAFRPQRILVMAPTAALPRIKDQWASFKGNPRDTGTVASIGNVANVDLPAMVLLKMAVDQRLLEFGLWDEVQVEIKAAEGSQLTIRGNDEARQRVLDWIKGIAQEGLTANEFGWAREAAIHHFETMQPDLQSLFWQRDKLGLFPNLQTVTAMHVQDVARIYF